MRDTIIGMWLSKGMQHQHPSTYTRRGTFFVDREFQIRYIMIVLAAGILGAAINLVPIYFFLEQNYQIFYDLAFKSAPQIIDHLERERVWIKLFSIGSFLSIVGFFSFVAFRMTSRIVGPLKVLSNHLKQITRGNWRLNSIKVRDNDEFQDLIESYNYFYSSYKTMMQRDLERLKTFNIDPSNRDAFISWTQMIDEKSRQLQKPAEFQLVPPVTLTAAKSSVSPDSRHAS